MTVATDRRMTLEEYLHHERPSDRRYELEDGVVIEMGSESPLNPSIAMFLVSYFLQTLGVPFQFLAIGHQIEVRSRYATARQPDLIIHTEASDAAIFSGEKILRLTSPSPRLVIEVASQSKTDSASRKRDYEWKASEYADRSIPEYWIVDPDREWVVVGTLHNGAYAFETFVRKQTIVSAAFPGLNLTAEQVLSAGRG
jgi:Uma2 family endonuclease